MNEDFNENEFDDILNDEDVYDSIMLTDDNGVEVEYFVIDALESDGNKYMLVVASDNFDDDEAEALIIKEVGSENEELIYEIVDDETEYNKVVVLLQDSDGDYEMQF